MENHSELEDKLVIAIGCLCGYVVRHDLGIQKDHNIEQLRESIEYLYDVKAAFFPEPAKPPCRIIDFGRVK
jgi:hypothetical protein